MEWYTTGDTEMLLCLHCDEDTEHTIEVVDGDIAVGTCPECGNETVIETRDND